MSGIGKILALHSKWFRVVSALIVSLGVTGAKKNLSVQCHQTTPS